MRFILPVILFSGLLSNSTGLAQLQFPLEEFYRREAERINYSDTTKSLFYSSHLSSQPLSQSRTQADSIHIDHQKRYYWLTQKLYKENFLLFTGTNFWCAVDPVVDLELGHDLAIDSLHYKYWNTRGLRVQAKFLNKVGFVTTFYENQAFVPDYQKEIFKKSGEFQPVSAAYYKQQNAVVPGYARTKVFKTTGYDFAFAQGYVSIEPNKNWNIHFGNGNHFIGNGHRSLLLSDNSTNSPFLKMESNLWKGRIQYQVMYQVLTNLYRLVHYTTPEATYERKLGAFHYLDIAVTPNIMLGVFEGSVWRRTDSLGSHKPDWAYFNPIIGANSLLKGSSDSSYNSIVGVNLSFRYKKNLLYGQVVIDESRPGAWQMGFKAFDLIVPKLDVMAEYNHAEQNTYLHNDERYNYSHYNLSLAHPLNAGFDELVCQINYNYKRWFFQNHTTYSASYQNDSLNLGTNILLPNSNLAMETYTRTKVFYNQFEVGYRFNKRYNL